MNGIITVTNQKGGIGKSTTVQAVGAGLSLRGYKVLLIDLDAQGNLTMATGAASSSGNAYQLLRGDIGPDQAIKPIRENLDIIPASPNLSRSDLDLNQTGKEYKLKEAIAAIKGRYDFIIIDTPPALGVLTINALTAADRVLIPAQADLFSLEAVKQLYSTIEIIKKYTNPELDIEGIILTRYSPRSVLTRELTELMDDTAKVLNTKLFKTAIREAIAIKEAQATQTDIFTYAPKSNVAQDYAAVIDELLQGDHGDE